MAALSPVGAAMVIACARDEANAPGMNMVVIAAHAINTRRSGCCIGTCTVVFILCDDDVDAA